MWVARFRPTLRRRESSALGRKVSSGEVPWANERRARPRLRRVPANGRLTDGYQAGTSLPPSESDDDIHRAPPPDRLPRPDLHGAQVSVTARGRTMAQPFTHIDTVTWSKTHFSLKEAVAFRRSHFLALVGNGCGQHMRWLARFLLNQVAAGSWVN